VLYVPLSLWISTFLGEASSPLDFGWFLKRQRMGRDWVESRRPGED